MEIWQKWADSSKNDPNRMALLNELKGLMERGKAPPTRRFDAYAVMLGHVWCLVAMSGEMFCQYELWIDEKAPFEHMMTFAYTNGYCDYVAVDKAYALGPKGGYEVTRLYVPNWGGWHSLCPKFSEHFGSPLIGGEGIVKKTFSYLWLAD
ncbi:MAG: hypothetical protein ACYSR9_04980 [Planctomycetota bacterium]|jgi:hypothetical protein